MRMLLCKKLIIWPKFFFYEILFRAIFIKKCDIAKPTLTGSEILENVWMDNHER